MDTVQCVNPKIPALQRDISTLGKDRIKNRISGSKDYTKWAVIMGGSYADGQNGSSIKAECSELYIMLCDTYSYSASNCIPSSLSISQK